MATVLQISDTHLRSEPNTSLDNNPDARLQATIVAARTVDPDLVLLTGDLADDGSLAALRRVREMVGALSSPVLALAGNHDDVGNVRAVFGHDDMAEVGSWRILAVESAIPGHAHGSVDVGELTARLDRLDDRPTMIAIHHPPRSPSTLGIFQLVGSEQMLAALRVRAHVSAVVSGHLHEAFDQRDSGLQLCGCPSTFYALENRGDDCRMAADGLVGAQVLTLGDEGSFACKRVARSLGC